MHVDVIKRSDEIQEKGDKKISIALMAPFIILTVQYFILISFNLIGSSKASTIQLVSKFLVGICFMYALPVAIKRSNIKLIGIYLMSISVFSLNYMVFESNRYYLKDTIFTLFFMSLPSFVYALSIKEFNTFKLYMKRASYIIVAVGSILGFLIFTGKASAGTYSMSLSYYMLLPTIFFIDDAFEKFSLKTSVLLFVSLIVIIALGSRGAILCILIFVMLKFLKSSTPITYKKVLGRVSIIGVSIIVWVYLYSILEFIYTLLLKYGIKSRTLLLFLRQEVHLSGRDTIYNQVIDKLMDNPLIGLGLLGDRVVLGGAYSHNFFIEAISHFGVILGVIISICCVILIVKKLLTRNSLNYSIYSMWLCLGFVHLLVSSSYVIDIKFWILMGLMLNPNTKKQLRLNS